MAIVVISLAGLAHAAVTVEPKTAWTEEFFGESVTRARVDLRTDHGKLLGVRSSTSALHSFRVGGEERLKGGRDAPFPEGIQQDGWPSSLDLLTVRLGAALPPSSSAAEVLVKATLTAVVGHDPDPVRLALPVRGEGEVRCGGQVYRLGDDPDDRSRRRLVAPALYGLADLRLTRDGEPVDLDWSTFVGGPDGAVREEAAMTFPRGPARGEVVLEGTCFRRLEEVTVPVEAALRLERSPDGAR